MLERLQKYIAHQGITSRRKAEDLIRQGKVYVNGEKAHIGQKIDPEKDMVEIHDDRLKTRKTDLVYYAFHKPRGVTSTMRRFPGEKSLKDFFPDDHKLVPAGRLDKESRGLMILTNDGELVHYLTHPSNRGEKEYYVMIDKPIDDLSLHRLKKGITYEGVEYKTVSVRQRKPKELRFVLREGKKRHIRMMLRACRYQVTDLIRVRINNYRLGKLKPGEFKKLSKKDLEKLSL